jgi:anti-sigma B factor antagonist
MAVTTEVEALDSGLAVVRCSGRITLGEGSAALRNVLEGLLAGGRPAIVLDFQEVPYIDSSGFGELVRGFTEAVNAGGDIVLARPGQRIKDVLRHTRLDTVFRSFETVDDAVSHLKANRKESE